MNEKKYLSYEQYHQSQNGPHKIAIATTIVLETCLINMQGHDLLHLLKTKIEGVYNEFFHYRV